MFATMMGIATVIHWDRFNHDHPAFIAWVALYAVTPFLVPALWVYNGGWRPAPVEPPDLEVPQAVRVALGVVGGALVAMSIRRASVPSSAPDLN